MGLKSFAKKRSKRFWVITAIFIVVLVLVLLVAKNLTDPSEGVVIESKKSTAKVINREISVRTDGKTVSFSRPAKFKEMPTPELSSQDVEKFNYLNPETISQNLTIQIRKLPSGVLSNDSSYNLRKINPAKYKIETKEINGNTFVIFTDVDGGYNKVAFTTKNGLEANIAITTSNASAVEDINKTFDKVLGRWEWR